MFSCPLYFFTHASPLTEIHIHFPFHMIYNILKEKMMGGLRAMRRRKKNPITSAIDNAIVTYIFGVLVCFAAVLHLLGIL